MKSKKRCDGASAETSDTKRRKVTEGDNPGETSETNLFLSSVNAFILQAGIEKMRMNIFQTQLLKYGGKMYKDLTDDVTHVVVDDKMEAERMCRLLKLDRPPDSVNVVKTSWLSACLKEKCLVDISEYILNCSKLVSEKQTGQQDYVSSSNQLVHGSNGASDQGDTEVKTEFPKVGAMFSHRTKTTHVGLDDGGDDESDYCPSGGEEDSDLACSTSDVSTPSTSPKKNLPVGNWVCAQSSKVTVENHNKHITDKLEEMVRTYESTNDKWRAFGSQKTKQTYYIV